MGKVYKQSDYATDKEWYEAAHAEPSDSGRFVTLVGDKKEGETTVSRGCFTGLAIGTGLLALGLGVAACGIEGQLNFGMPEGSAKLTLDSANPNAGTDDFPQLSFPQEEGVSYLSYLARS
jgi:hypothetical protein